MIPQGVTNAFLFANYEILERGGEGRAAAH